MIRNIQFKPLSNIAIIAPPTVIGISVKGGLIFHFLEGRTDQRIEAAMTIPAVAIKIQPNPFSIIKSIDKTTMVKTNTSSRIEHTFFT